MDSTPRYRAFVLRAWEVRQATQDTGAIWRYALQDPATAQWHQFEKLDQLVVFITGELADQPRRVGSEGGWTE